MKGTDIRTRLGSLVDGRYRLLRILGEGGMGAVFEAERVADGGRVAVKLIKPEFVASAEVVGRFVQEVEAVTAIGHPNIVRVLDAGMDGYGPFLVLELLRGETLCDVMERRPLGYREALSIIAQTLEGLCAAHRAGVVHRDIKPENIYLLGSGDHPSGVKLLDFGISKVMSEQARGGLTRVGVAVGTPDYMSPEQASAGRIDGRADLWSLGAVLYQCLCQATPFDGKTYQELLSRIMLHRHTPLRERIRDVPPYVEAVVDRALEKEPDRRYGSADEMLAAVREALRALPADTDPGARPDEPTAVFSTMPRAGAIVVPPVGARLALAAAEETVRVPSEFDRAEALDPDATRRVESMPAPPMHAVIPSPMPAPDGSRRAMLGVAALGTLCLVLAAALITARSRMSSTAAVTDEDAATVVVPAPQAVASPPAPVVAQVLAAPSTATATSPVQQVLAAPSTAASPVQQVLAAPSTVTASPVQQVLAAPSTATPSSHPTAAAVRRAVPSVRPAPRVAQTPAATDPSLRGTPLSMRELGAMVSPYRATLDRQCVPNGPHNIDLTLNLDARGVARFSVASPAAGTPANACVRGVLSRVRMPAGRPTASLRVLFSVP